MLGLVHECTGHLNKRSIIECVKSKLVKGLQVEDKHIRNYVKDDKHVCDVCARAKLTRMSFAKIHRIRGTALGDYISVDLAVFINCPSREGIKYVACFLDHGTKMSWVYGLKTKNEYYEKFIYFVDVELKRHSATIKHYHADGGAELISKQVLTVLKREGSRYTWNPADTPELNATSERKFRTLGERCLSMLLRAGRRRLLVGRLQDIQLSHCTTAHEDREGLYHAVGVRVWRSAGSIAFADLGVQGVPANAKRLSAQGLARQSVHWVFRWIF